MLLSSFRLVFVIAGSLLVEAALTRRPPHLPDQEALASREYFYVGGAYEQLQGGSFFTNQMYVEKLFPLRPCQPFPLVLIHGNAQSGTNWLNKPDGGRGWASYFLDQGYIVYIIDQTERARSPWSPFGDTNLTANSAEYIERRFTATQDFNLWPQAVLHTQWPGSGRIGDPIFDAFYSSQIQFQVSNTVQETKMQSAGAALLRKIGPAVLIAHSQGGLMPWVIADVVPDLVKAIVAIEPTGPPFMDTVFTTAAARKYGLTDIPLTYSPAIENDTAPFETQVIANDAPGLSTCMIQASPARQLVNFKNIPVLVETAEASFHAVYDGCTYKFLKQAGVPAEFIRLEDIGIHGNGHMQFLEKNSDQIADVILDWIRGKIT